MIKNIHTFDAARFVGTVSMFTSWITDLDSESLRTLRGTLEETERSTSNLELRSRVRLFAREIDKVEGSRKEIKKKEVA